MENPASWGEAERIIDRALDEHEQNMRRADPLIGWSLPKRIAEALRAAGLLTDRPHYLKICYPCCPHCEHRDEMEPFPGHEHPCRVRNCFYTKDSDKFMSCPCGGGDYSLCTGCPYDWCSVHGNLEEK